MAEEAARRLFQNHLSQIPSLVESKGITPTEVIETKQLPPSKFLELYYSKELILFQYFSREILPPILQMIFIHSERAIKQVDRREPKFSSIYSLCVNYALAESCIEAFKLAKKESGQRQFIEIIVEDFAKTIISHSNLIYTSDFGKFTQFIRHQYSNLLGVLGSISINLYIQFFSKIQQEFAENSKTLSGASISWIYMPASVQKIPKSLNPILLQILDSKISDKMMPSICDMILQTITMALHRNIPAFHKYLAKNHSPDSYKIYDQLYEELGKCNEKKNHPSWPAMMLLRLLRLPSLSPQITVGEWSKPDSFLSQINTALDSKGTQLQQAAHTIFVGYGFVALSNGINYRKDSEGNPISFLTPFKEKIVKIFTEGKFSPQTPDQFSSAYIQFPVAMLFAYPKIFEEKILPVLKQESKNMDTWGFLARVIRRACKQRADPNAFESLPKNKLPDLHELFDPIIFLFEKALDTNEKAVSSSQKAIKTIPIIFKAFKHYPPMFHQLVLKDERFLPDLLFKFIETKTEINPSSALIGFFDISSDNIQFEPVFWKLISKFTHFLLKNYFSMQLFNKTDFGSEIPQIIMHITDFILFQLQNCTIEELQISEDCLFGLTNIESSALVFLSSSNREIRFIGVSLISAMLNIYHTSEVFDTYALPVDEYQRLVGSCKEQSKAIKSVTNADNSIKHSLRIISEPTDAILHAWSGLFWYFISLTKKMDPSIISFELPTNSYEANENDDNSFIPVKESPISEESISVIADEWIGTCSMLFSLLFESEDDKIKEKIDSLYKLLIPLLYSSGDLGIYAVATIPSGLTIRHYGTIVKHIGQKILELNISTGEVTQSDQVFMMNALKLIQGISDQPNWPQPYHQYKEIKINELMSKIIDFGGLCQNEDLRLISVQCIISLFNLSTSFGFTIEPPVRNVMARSILAWLPNLQTRPADSQLSKRYTSYIHKALALLLDGLNLTQCNDSNSSTDAKEQAEAQFMHYFASIKARLDHGEDSATDLAPVLSALIKENLEIAIEHCISMGFSDKNNVRSAFIAAVASAFRIPDNSSTDTDENDLPLIDLFFASGSQFIDLVCSLIPYSRAEVFGAAIIEAAICRKREFELLDHLIQMEVSSVDESSKNTLFRGNAVPARAVGHFPRLVGTEWMTKHLRPLFEKVIKNCTQGINYIVDPNKLPEGQNLEENCKNFRDLMSESIEIICSSASDMPPALIKESQLIYNRVSEKYSDFALRILAGFLFLRFLLPAFTVPKNVGLGDILPPLPRGALIQISAALMAATLHGKLDDKGPYLVQFNDLARSAQQRFFSMFDDIVQKEVDISSCNLTFDEAQISNTFHAEIFPILPQISSALEDSDSVSDNRVGLIFLNRIHQMGSPAGNGTRRVRTGTISQAMTSKSKKGPAALLTMKFPQESLDQLSDFFVKDDDDDKSIIFYADFSKIPTVPKDPRIIAYFILKAVDKANKVDSSKPINIIMNMSDFSDNKVPSASEIKGYLTLPQATKIKNVALVELNSNFIQFVKYFPNVIDKKCSFPKDLSQLLSLIGTSSAPKVLPSSTLEALSKPSTLSNGFHDNLDCTIRVHEHSIQILDNQIRHGEKHISVSANGQPLNTTIVIMAQSIEKCVQKVQDKDKNIHFSIVTKPNASIGLEAKTYQLEIPPNSSVYEQSLAMLERHQTISSLRERVKVDNSTLHWLMLNMAFVNIVTERVQFETRVVSKPSVDLIYAVISLFNIQHSMNVRKTSNELLPDSLLGWVEALSADIAAHQPDQVNGFLNEYCKVYEYLDNKWKGATLMYLRPWVGIYAQNVESKPDFVKFLFDSFIELQQDRPMFEKTIWRQLAAFPGSLSASLKYIAESENPKLLPALLSFGALKPAAVSHLWAAQLFPKPNNYFCIGCQLLLSNHLFDMGSLPEIIFKVTSLRLYTSYAASADLFIELVHSILLHKYHLYQDSGEKIEPSDVEITDGVVNGITLDTLARNIGSTDGSREFQSSKDCSSREARKWLAKALNVAFFLQGLLATMSDVKKALFDLYKEQMKDQAPMARAQAIIYAAAFVPPENSNFSHELAAEFKKEKTTRGRTALCLALSLTKPEPDLSAWLLLLGVNLAYAGYGLSGVDLAAAMLANCCGKIPESMPAGAFNYVQMMTELNFLEDPIGALSVSATAFSDGDLLVILKHLQWAKFLSMSSNLLLNLMLTVYEMPQLTQLCSTPLPDEREEEDINEMLSSDEKMCSSTAAGLFILLKGYSKSKKLVREIEKVLESSPEIFAGFEPRLYEEPLRKAEALRALAMAEKAAKEENTKNVSVPLLSSCGIIPELILNQERVEKLISKVSNM